MPYLDFKLNLCAAAVLTAATLTAAPLAPFGPEPPVPAFSISYMDQSVSPAKDFYSFADGQWVKENPVPPDKSRWASFSQLAERNSYLIHGLLEDAAAAIAPKERRGARWAISTPPPWTPIGWSNCVSNPSPRPEAHRQHQKHERPIPRPGAIPRRGRGRKFRRGSGPGRPAKLHLRAGTRTRRVVAAGSRLLPQGLLCQTAPGLSRTHGEDVHAAGKKPDDAAAHAGIVLDLETDLAKASRSRVELRDPIKNYNKFSRAELLQTNPAITWQVYLSERHLDGASYAIVGQPEYFAALDKLIRSRPLADWQVYLRWHLLRLRSLPVPRCRSGKL